MKKLKHLLEELKHSKVEFLFAWYDLWIGIFWDKKKRALYILPLPMVGVVIKFQTTAERDKRIYRDWMGLLSDKEKQSYITKLLRHHGKIRS
jgi:hypothetical protein